MKACDSLLSCNLLTPCFCQSYTTAAALINSVCILTLPPLQVALLEVQPGSNSLSWPWVSRGTAEKGVTKVQAWDIVVPSGSAANSDLARAVAALNYGYSGLIGTAFGNAGKMHGAVIRGR
jgi:hypothetical protein